MVSPIPSSVKKIWESWNIRGIILLSLSLQTVLILFAPCRKRTSRSLVTWSIWSAYLLADWAASFCVGLISNSQDDDNSSASNSSTTGNQDLLAFWSPFLLLHLGGPDTITAFALEDNELWLRHLLGLIFQVAATLYVFLQTIPKNRLWIPTTLLFVAGIVKYGERTRALYLASLDSFRKSMLGKPDPGPNYAKLMEEYSSKKDADIPVEIVMIPEPIKENKDRNSKNKNNNLSDLDVVEQGYKYFYKFKGLIVDLIFSVSDRIESCELFHSLQPSDALRVITVELNFIYEALYTKLQVVHTNTGYFFRFVSFSSVAVALGLFTSEEKHGFKKFDVGVTYALLYGAIALDSIALFRLVFSDMTAVSLTKSRESSFKATLLGLIIKVTNFLSILEYFLSFKKLRWSQCERKHYTNYKALNTPFFSRRWSESISGHNLITYCLEQCPKKSKSEAENRVYQFFMHISDKILWCWRSGIDYVVEYVGAGDLLDEWTYKFKMPFLQELWRFIFLDLKRKSKDVDDAETVKWICSSRGALILRGVTIKNEKQEVTTKEKKKLRERLIPYIEEVAYEESLILWHIATDLCYYEEEKQDKVDQKNKQEDAHFIIRISKMIFAAVIIIGSTVEEIMKRILMIIGGIIKKVFETVKGTLMIIGVLIEKIFIRKNHGEAAAKVDEKDYVTENDKREFSKILSDYMLYLLIMQPTMMSAVAGIGQIRFRDTCAEAKNFFTRRDVGPIYGKREAKKLFRRGDLDPKAIKAACDKILNVNTDVKPVDVKGDRSKSVLFDACRLAKELRELKEEKWNVISQVWVELLSYAATHCRANSHAQQVSKGGELVSLVWLLMAHFGLGEQFQIKEGHARAKLIVDEPEDPTPKT
ncbi:Protein of unknown function (DUF594) [Quillaja saponaria]|uniref:DUF4220 domain-containing protein n=1 Tax=Quillaja saponaria TaxID=32244 RepID=A0AAD7VJR6_QUISA|nr:Protein of unknown function (DUF594) [Quillaja saponaria]